MKAKETRPVQVTFTLKKHMGIKVHDKQLTQTEEAKYLGKHLDRKLTWRKHILTERKQLDLKLRRLHWVTGRK